MKEFKLIISKKAENQTEEVFFHYNLISDKVADNFLIQLYNCINSIHKNPTIFQVFKKHFRQVPLKKYPYVVVYSIENKNVIVILSVFHTSRNPNKKFR
jgi:toxin ParE1/3/4